MSDEQKGSTSIIFKGLIAVVLFIAAIHNGYEAYLDSSVWDASLAALYAAVGVVAVRDFWKALKPA